MDGTATMINYAEMNYLNVFDHLKNIDLKKLPVDELKVLQEKLKEFQKYWEIKNQIYKVNVINSLYGITDKDGSPIHNPHNAEAITMGSAFGIRSVMDMTHELYNDVKCLGINFQNDGIDCFYNDTDSVFMEQSGVPKFNTTRELSDYLLKIANEQIEPAIKNHFNQMGRIFNVENKIKMGVDEICDQVIMHSPKLYIGRYIYKNGKHYDKTDYYWKIKGLQLKRRDFPKWSRKMMVDFLPVLFDGTNNDAIDYMWDCKKKFMSLDLKAVAKPIMVKDMTAYSLNDPTLESCEEVFDDISLSSNESIVQKGTPRHVKSALFYNKFLIDRKLDGKYKLLTNGSKIVYVYLYKKASAELGCDSIAINVYDKIPPELMKIIDGQINYDVMWDKIFIKPMKVLLDAVSWSFEKQDNFLLDL